MSDGDYLSDSELATIGLHNCGRAVSVSRHAILIHPERITLGSHVRIDAFCILTAGPDGIVIGDRVHVSAGVHIYGGGGLVRLDDFVCVSGKVSIYTVNDDYSEGWLSGPMVPEEFRHVQKGDVILERYALVGCQSVILPNVNLGQGCAIGALSLVKESVPEGHLVGGSPARFLGMRNLDRLLELESELKVRPESE